MAVAKLHIHVSRFLSEQGIPRTEPLLVAVSGGADSCALLQILVALGQSSSVAHVHHGLRGGAADADLEFVRARAQALGLPYSCAHVDATVRDGRSPEARARVLRYAALNELRERGGCSYIATAHTLDDQAETVLLRAIRGTGPAGLAGIAARSSEGHLLRPLLGVRGEELRSYLRERGLAWREDESNQDLGIPRNRLRAQVLPILEAIHPAAVSKLGGLAQAARESDACLREITAPVLEAALEERDHGLWIDPAPLLELAPALRMRAVSQVLVAAGLAERISASHLRRVAQFLEDGQSGKTLSLPQCMTLLCDRDRFWLGPEPGPRFPAWFSAPLLPPRALELPERDLRLSWRNVTCSDPRAKVLSVPRELSLPLIVRSPLPGDRMKPSEKAASVALQDLFSAARWSRRARARAVVVEHAHEVVWVVGLAQLQKERKLNAGDWELVAELLSPHRQTC